MFYTPSDAGDKRCTPALVILLMDAERLGAAIVSGTASTKCVGPECAQWRWKTDMAPSGGGERLGYCGLASKPQGAL